MLRMDALRLTAHRTILMLAALSLSGCQLFDHKKQDDGAVLPPRGVASVGGNRLVTQDVGIPDAGLSLGEALLSLRDPETMKLRLVGLGQATGAGGVTPTSSPATESDMVVRVARGNSVTYIPLFLAQNTDARLTPLSHGDSAHVVEWKDTSLLPSQFLPPGKPIQYTLTGLINKPGKYTGTSGMKVAAVPSKAGMTVGQDGSQADIILLRRKNGNLNETFVIPLPLTTGANVSSPTIGGVSVPSDLALQFATLLGKFVVRDGDVYQFTQLQLLPTVIAGKMLREIQAQTGNAAAQQGLRERVRHGVTAHDANRTREPGAVSDAWRRFRLSIPPLPGLPTL